MRHVFIPVATGQGINHGQLEAEINERLPEGLEAIVVPGMTGNAVVTETGGFPAPPPSKPTNNRTNRKSN